ncbi:MAG TPA: YoaK family protein [Microlunatus sp.]
MTVTSSSLRFALLITGSGGFLDAYTVLARGGVFATAQTGNVVFLALNLAHGEWRQASAHLWPIVAFILGVAIATHVKQGRLDHVLPFALRWTIALQAVVLAVVGFIPATVPPSLVTIPVAFVAALQIELFRNIGDLNSIAVATTGNLMRWVEAGYGRIVTGDPASGTAFRTYSLVITTFATGALVGAIATRGLGVHASWVPAALIAGTLLLFVLDDRAESSE